MAARKPAWIFSWTAPPSNSSPQHADELRSQRRGRAGVQGDDKYLRRPVRKNGRWPDQPVTKSGSNSLHGDAYDILRNKSLDANSWISNLQKQPRDSTRRTISEPLSPVRSISQALQWAGQDLLMFNYEASGFIRRKRLNGAPTQAMTTATFLLCLRRSQSSGLLFRRTFSTITPPARTQIRGRHACHTRHRRCRSPLAGAHSHQYHSIHSGGFVFKQRSRICLRRHRA